MMYYNNKRLVLSLFWIVLGITLLALSVAGILDSALYSGFGGGMLAVGILQMARNLKYRKNPEYKEKIDIELTDERSRFLRMKAWSWAGYTAVLAGAVASLIAYLLGNMLIGQVLSLSLCFVVFAYWLSYLILSRKY